MSRDPIGELGGLNLYASVSNDPVRNNDAFGLWTDITREGGRRAVVCSDSSSDTWATLAVVARTASSQFALWAQEMNGSPVSGSPVQGRSYTVPNTYFIGKGPRVYVGYYIFWAYKMAAEAYGMKVVYEDRFQTVLNDPDAYGLVYLAHGTEHPGVGGGSAYHTGGIRAPDGDFQPPTSVSLTGPGFLAAVTTPVVHHALGEMRIAACKSSLGKWENYASINGKVTLNTRVFYIFPWSVFFPDGNTVTRTGLVP